MFYKQTDTVFNLKRKDGWIKVIPFNGETERFLFKGVMVNQMSWSAGFTHYKFEDGTYAGFCGINYFEENAKKLGPAVERDYIKV